jgi:peptidyl-prolyl cis-trans isomerase B (cyclophilin B)
MFRTTPSRFCVQCGLACIAAAAVANPIAGQVSPSRTYFGINRPVPVVIERPEGADGELAVALLGADDAELSRASCGEGQADLASLFPAFWAESSAGVVRYAQLFAGDAPVGPAIVLQPMVTPRTAQPRPGTREMDWPESPSVLSGVRAYPEKHAVMSTSEGDIVFRMRPEHAPNTVWNFLSLADGGFYTDVIFHRVVPGRGGGPPFVIQAGDPRGEGMGGPGYFIDLERSGLLHDFGVLSMARSNDPDSNGSQIFVCLSREATMPLDGLYTSFGEAVEGAEAIIAIERTPLGPDGSRPVDPPVIRSVRLVDAPPRGTGPQPVTRPQPAESRER